MYVYVPSRMPGAQESQKRVSNPLGLLGLETMWVLEIEPRPCGRTEVVLNTEPSLSSVL